MDQDDGPARRRSRSPSSSSAGCPYYLGGLATTRRFTYNDRENDGLTPASFQLAFEEVVVPARRTASR